MHDSRNTFLLRYLSAGVCALIPVIFLSQLSRQETGHRAMKAVPYRLKRLKTVTSYEGHLWVTDESTKIVKRLFWQNEAPYTKISWEKSGLYIKYADGKFYNRNTDFLVFPCGNVYNKYNSVREWILVEMAILGISGRQESVR